ncbi:protein nessun dorma [Bacillus rossius redtenbacheri]|uniref:protein nessun dorma n=1 Tax=Bacillus rossius redtenbacheri TaxID=93214 RepID=UPI002FDCE02D
MNKETYFFDKTKEDRLREFQNILCLTEKPIPASEIKNEWVFFLQEVIEPTGWNAVWYVSREECEELAIHFPTVFLVAVENVDFKNLSARVEIIAVKEEAVIAKKHMAGLRQLYPTITQDEMIAMNLERTVDYLEQFRFFFDYVWMPWDEDSNEQDWPSSHLESRLDMYYDLVADGLRSTAVYVRALLQEGKDVHRRIRSLEESLGEDGAAEEEADQDHGRVQALVELHLRQEQTKGEVERLESPVLRTFIIKKQQKQIHAGEVLCVCEVATADEIVGQIAVVKSLIKPSTPIKMLPSLQEALNHVTCGQQIFLFPGIHHIKSDNVEAALIKGLGGRGATTLASLSSSSCLLRALSREVSLEGLTLDAGAVQMALAVSAGSLRLRDCRVVGAGPDGSGEGVVVLEGGCLRASLCEFVSFGTAISARAGATVCLEACSISDCHVGILMSENANVMLEKTSVGGCKDCGIKIETTKLNEGATSQYGTQSLLESFSTVKLEECVISDCTRGDVQLYQQPPCMLYDSLDSGCSFTEL